MIMMVRQTPACRVKHDHVVWPAEYAKRLAADLKTAFRLLPDIVAFLNDRKVSSAGMLLHHSAIACTKHRWTTKAA